MTNIQNKPKFIGFLLAIFVALSLIAISIFTMSASASSAVAWNDTNENGIIDEGETTYDTLENALKDKHRHYIRLCADTSHAEAIYIYHYDTSNASFTLDLNGHTVELGATIYLYSGLDVTIKDSSATGRGSMTTDDSANALIKNHAALTIESGSFTATDNVIANSSGAMLTINGGIFTSMGRTSNTFGQSGTMTVNGGEFYTHGYSVIYMNTDASQTTINGGYFGEAGSWAHINMYRLSPLDLSGHSDPTAITVMNSTGSPVSASSITLKSGYFFVDESRSVASELENRKLYIITADLTAYTVTFDADGGSGEMQAREATVYFSLPSCTFTPPAGKRFKCWMIDGVEYDAGKRISLRENITAKAVWLTPTVYFYNGDQLVTTLTVDENYSFIMPSAPSTPGENVLFRGWAIYSPTGTLYAADTVSNTSYASVNYYAVFEEVQVAWGSSASALTDGGTLAEAISAASSDESIKYIRLYEDIVISSTLTVSGGDFTLDLYGCNLVNEEGNYEKFFKLTSGHMNVTNTKNAGGTMTGNANLFDIGADASLTVSGGIFRTLNSTPSFDLMGSMTVNGGDFLAMLNSTVFKIHSPNASLTLNGGKFLSASGAWGIIQYTDGRMDLSGNQDPRGVTIFRQVSWDSGELLLPEGYELYLLETGELYMPYTMGHSNVILSICKTTGHTYACADIGSTHEFRCACGYVYLESHTNENENEDHYCDVCKARVSDCDYNENGFCIICDAYEPTACNEQGYYEISNAGQLFWFADYINTVDRTANAILTADIDLENRPWTPIGSTGEESNNFRGHFDGQNHTVKGLYVEGGRAGLGFFGEVRLGMIENFTIYGEVKLVGKYDYVGGVIGSAPGLNSDKPEHNGATIRNITSYVNVTLGEGSHGSNRVGGFIGYVNHDTLIENCTWYGTLDLGPYRAQDGVGGLVGKANDNSAITIRNCAAYGTIKTSYQSGSYNDFDTIFIGGILSNSVANAKSVIENTIWAGTIVNETNLGEKAHISAFGTMNGFERIQNCYALDNMPYVTTYGAQDSHVTVITEAQLASGEIAYLLGEAFGQEIGTDAYPILGGMRVYGYYTSCAEHAEMLYTNDASVSPEKPAHSKDKEGDCAVTCQSCAYCSVCESYYGEIDPDAHAWLAATYQTPKTCEHCETTEGEAVTYPFADALLSAVTFEGYQARLYGTPAIRAIFSLNAELVAQIEAANVRVSYGITLADAQNEKPQTHVLNADYGNRFLLTLEGDVGNVSTEYVFCAFITLEDAVGTYTVTFEAESERFGNAVSIAEICTYLYGNGYENAPAIASAADVTLPEETVAWLPLERKKKETI